MYINNEIINIHSNGSKWAGEENDTIEKLIEVLNTNTIEERFFYKYYKSNEHGYKVIPCNLCPIDNNGGIYTFFGNFEEVSHVFNIETNNEKIIHDLVISIKANKGWKLYYKKNL